MLGDGEREHMGHLVPERAAPVKLAGLTSGRAIHRNEIAERDAEQADARQARSAHREVIVVRINLDRHRLRGLEGIAVRVSRDRLARDFFDVRTHRVRFLLVEPGHDVRRVGAHDAEVLQLVEYAKRVHRGRAERVAGVGLFKRRA